jgi:hypothetical protein
MSNTNDSNAIPCTFQDENKKELNLFKMHFMTSHQGLKVKKEIIPNGKLS